MRGRLMLAALAATLTTACGEDEEPSLGGACRTALWAKPLRPGEALSVRGSWDEWGADRSMRAFEDGWYVAELDLDPGEYGYLVVEEGKARLDRYNGQSFFRRSDEQEVSRLVVDDCRVPRVEVVGVEQIDAGTLRLDVTATAATQGPAVDGLRYAAPGGSPRSADVDPATGAASLTVSGLAPGKHSFELWADDTAGASSPKVRASGFVDPVAPTWADGIIYQVVTDRFRVDDGSPPPPPPTSGSRAGGTLRGVTTALEDGYFASLGVSALWLSPVYVNPQEAREGRDDDYLYEGYHGYWPVASRGVDERIGGDAALRELISVAHGQGIRVLLDLVPNHMYESNPRVAEHAGDDWFHQHDPPCVCGSATCPWSDFIRTCWFADYLPDLRFENPDVLSLAAEDARWWYETYDVDGFRIDAIPMMPRAASRRIAHDLRRAAGTRGAAFTLGEIFTGAGPGGTADLAYYLGPDGLDSAFDFPLMWALREAVAHDGAGFDAVEASLALSDARLDGSGSILARMIGNHDVTRFASESAGDAGQHPWENPPPEPTQREVFERQALALGLVLTLPGLPILYYGDEIGLGGAADPDNRRVLPASLSEDQAWLRSRVETLAAARRCLPALRQGARVPLRAGEDVYIFARDAGDGTPAVVVASRRDEASSVEVPSAPGVSGGFVDVIGGTPVAVPGPIELPAFGLAVLVPAGTPCAG